MLERPTLRSTWLPLGLALASLVILNVGLYTRLAFQPLPPRFEIPYYEDFSALTLDQYEIFGGDWEIRDQSLVQLSTSGYDLLNFVSINIDPEQPYIFESSVRYLGGTMGGGLIFNAQQTTSRQKSHMMRLNVDADKLWLIYGYFGDDSDFISQGSAPLSIPVDDSTPHRLRVEVSDTRYALLVDDVVMVRDIPLMYRGGAVGFISATSQVAFDDVKVDAPSAPAITQEITQPTEQVQQAPTAAPDSESQAPLLTDTFDGEGGAALWQPISGEWRFEQGAYTQTQAEGFDLSSVYQQTFSPPLTVQATFQHQTGVGGGVLFNLPNGDTKNGGYMVRYFEDGSVIAWGYFDENGVFNGQGSVGVSLPQTTSHTLAVSVSDESYAVNLDGVELAAGIPLYAPLASGYVGLTASQSVVTFDNFNVSDARVGAEVGTTTSAATIDAALASGQWVVEGSTITQTDTAKTDFIAGTGLAGERFTISVQITLPTDTPDSGAGIVFHMEGRDDPKLGYMVRFGSGGKELFWGQYDEQRNFIGQGGIPVDLTAGTAHELMLTVRDTSFDIRLDGVAIVEAIPIVRNSGWIGLVSFSGPVYFSNVNIKLGE